MAQKQKVFIKLLMAIGNDLVMEVPVSEQAALTSDDLPENCWGYQYLTHNVVELDGSQMMEADPVSKSGVTYVGVEVQKSEIYWDIGDLDLKDRMERSGVTRCAVCTHPSRGTMIFPLFCADRVIHRSATTEGQAAA